MLHSCIRGAVVHLCSITSPGSSINSEFIARGTEFMKQSVIWCWFRRETNSWCYPIETQVSARHSYVPEWGVAGGRKITLVPSAVRWLLPTTAECLKIMPAYWPSPLSTFPVLNSMAFTSCWDKNSVQSNGNSFGDVVPLGCLLWCLNTLVHIYFL